MRLVPYHKDSAYLIHWLGMDEVIDVEPKPGIPPSAGYLAELLTKLQAQPADAITRAACQDPKAVEWLSERNAVGLAASVWLDLPSGAVVVWTLAAAGIAFFALEGRRPAARL